MVNVANLVLYSSIFSHMAGAGPSILLAPGDTESGGYINMMEASGSSGGLNPGRGEVNMGGSSRGSGWTSFDLDILAEPFPDEEGEAISQPKTQNTPAGITNDSYMMAGAEVPG